MPIPLGVLAVAGAGAGPSPVVVDAYEHLETTLITTNTASVTFSNLNTNYGSTYRHLQIRVTSRDSRSTTGGNNVRVTLNNNTSANYASHRLRGDGTSVTSLAASSGTNMNLFASVSANDGANIFGAAIIDILDPFETTKNTTLRVLHGQVVSAGPAVEFRSGFWNNTAAVTSISFVPETTGNFVAGTRFSLYGLKA